MPVMYALSSEARNIAALPRSSGVPIRPSGTEATADALSFSVMKWERPGVAVYPGLNTLTRMSRPLRSTIQVRANERIAAFDASYTKQAAKPLIDTIEPRRLTDG